MEKHGRGRRGVARAAMLLGFAGLLAACADRSGPPAPVLMKGGGLGIVVNGPPSEAQLVVVRPGQTVRSIARDHHVKPDAIIAANHLQPPYKIKTGARLLVPGVATMAAAAPAHGPAETPPVATVRPPPAAAAAARPPQQIIPLDEPAPARPPPPAPAATAAAAPPAGATPPAIAFPPAAPSPSSAPAAPSARQPSPPAEARAEPAPAALPRGAHFPWPVRGHVLAGYGTAPGGGHNDGINIGAPRGAPVAAIDGGTVAYAGNEVRGYGNLILIKHANGWISAYAHCDALMVKKGDQVTRGQVIAKVGTTGGVREPQLHFELRQGKKPVDPREFLTPSPSAAVAKSSRMG
jgi:murein DD-endopeptidase MepM/ murein hydrolase activator NlpD